MSSIAIYNIWCKFPQNLTIVKEISSINHAITKWDPIYSQRVFSLAVLGASEKVLAAAFNVHVNTIAMWKKTQPEFMEEFHRGQTEALANVAFSLYNRATGYDYEEEEVHVIKGKIERITVKKHMKADTWAAVKFLNLKGREFGWSESHNPTLTNNNININNFDLTVLSKDELKAMTKLGLNSMQQEDKDIEDAQIENDRN